MNTDKQLNQYKTKNQALEQELLDVRQKLDELQTAQMEPDVRMSELIVRLETIEKEWSEALADIHKQQAIYRQLNAELLEFRNKMLGDRKTMRRVERQLS